MQTFGVAARLQTPGVYLLASSVTHFEIYAEEPAKLADFYRNLFGWQVEQAPGIDYWRIQTGAGDGGAISGGLTYHPIPGTRSWVHYVNVVSLDETVAQVQRLGGAVLRPKTPVPKTAWYAVVADPEGNIFAVWQPDPTAFPPPEPD
jgi:predicted enzyme related to lactoylglutathione lyase